MGRPRTERVRDEATRLLQAGVSGQVFPGGSACIAWRKDGEEGLVQAVGGKLSLPQGPPVEHLTFYDLASVTKPVTATAALRLIVAGKLTRETIAETVLPDVRGAPGGAATIEQLFTHRANLAPWGGLYLDVPHEIGTSAARRWIVSEASRRPRERPGNEALYSDLGYIVGGEVLARVAGESLDRVLNRYVTDPLALSDQMFFAGALTSDKRASMLGKTAPTERCEWRGRIVRGEVHDENSAALGGVSGHAGLFGTARAVALFGRAMLDVLAGISTFLPVDVLRDALAERPLGSHRFGWDVKSGDSPAAGRRMGPGTFGHLGFTGTSLWCDPTRHLAVALLTNRIHPSRANLKIRGFRPAFHDGVVAAFDAD